MTDETKLARDAMAGIALFDGYKGPVTRLGGLTNLVFEAGQYCLRIPGKGTEEYINRAHEAVAARVGLNGRVIEEMYRIMALADYEDRFVIPTTHREQVEEAYDLKGGCSFTDGNSCSTGISTGSLFGGSKKPLKMPEEVR